MLSRVNSATIRGFNPLAIGVEVDLTRGLPAFDIVGLPDKAVRESRERVRPAIKNSGFEFPVQKITINLAPASVKKIGPQFDLPIALGIMAAGGVIASGKLAGYAMIGELSLSGEVRQVAGVLPIAMMLKDSELRGLIVPEANYSEARLVEQLQVIPVRNLRQAAAFLNDEHNVIKYPPENRETGESKSESVQYSLDFAEIKGQPEAKRALEIAAAGRHNVLLIGPPGAGKTMLARRLRTILPPLTEKEALELTKIYSIMGLIEEGSGLFRERPFRAPHHSISRVGLIGGGQLPEPGEVSLAHRGTLFMDELPEFNRDVLEMLRQPLEEGEVTIVRSALTATFPADFTLLAAMNPCPCGYYGDEHHQCTCSLTRINRYRDKISGPLLDRIDIHIEVPSLEVSEITSPADGESSRAIKARVIRAHNYQQQRYQQEGFNHNSRLEGASLGKYCPITDKGKVMLEEAIERLGLSARAYDRVLKLARTIADLEETSSIKTDHLAEAIQYRSFDRKL